MAFLVHCKVRVKLIFRFIVVPLPVALSDVRRVSLLGGVLT